MPDVEVVITPTPDVVVEVTEEGSPPVNVTLTPPPEVVEVQVPGPAGPPGEQGEPGPSGGISPYTHSQNSALATWTVTHNLGRKPAVSVRDSADNEVEGDVQHTSVNQLILNFSSPFSGEAYLV